jgi:hypothetical protein
MWRPWESRHVWVFPKSKEITFSRKKQCFEVSKQEATEGRLTIQKPWALTTKAEPESQSFPRAQVSAEKQVAER